MSNPKRPVSTVEEFIKVFHEMSARYGRSELWYDYIDMHAIALANTCDLRCRDAREGQYNAIVRKYDEKTVQQFAVLTAITMTALLENPEQDFLGTVYHNLGLSKSQAESSHQQIFGLRISILLWTRKPLKIHTNKKRSNDKSITHD